MLTQAFCQSVLSQWSLDKMLPLHHMPDICNKVYNVHIMISQFWTPKFNIVKWDCIYFQSSIERKVYDNCLLCFLSICGSTVLKPTLYIRGGCEEQQNYWMMGLKMHATKKEHKMEEIFGELPKQWMVMEKGEMPELDKEDDCGKMTASNSRCSSAYTSW